jgi:hypothetical protein
MKFESEYKAGGKRNVKTDDYVMVSHVMSKRESYTPPHPQKFSRYTGIKKKEKFNSTSTSGRVHQKTLWEKATITQ